MKGVALPRPSSYRQACWTLVTHARMGPVREPKLHLNEKRVLLRLKTKESEKL